MAEGENLSKHAAIASQKALEMAGINAGDIDLILLATSSPDDLFGSAGQVQPHLNQGLLNWGGTSRGATCWLNWQSDAFDGSKNST